MKKGFLVMAIVCSHLYVHAQDTTAVARDTAVIPATSNETSVTTTSTTTQAVATYTPAPEGRQHVYNVRPWLDIPLTVATDAWSLYGMSVIYGRDEIPQSEIDGLNRNNVNKFDRPIIDNYSKSAKSTSDLFFYGSMPLPLFLLLDKDIRRDGPRVGLLWLQAMGITGTIYTTSAMIANRYRPYAYNPAAGNDRKRGGARNSFFAGHPAVVATSTFFMAKVYTDYHPNMKGKWILYTVAGGATAATGFLRLAAGQHFRTDVITGVTIGTAVGILVPHLHKNKKLSGKLAIYPNIQPGSSNGLTAVLKL